MSWIDQLGLDPTAGMGPCSACGVEYVPAGGLCRDCAYSRYVELLREDYPRDEAEVRALVEFEYYDRRVQAMVKNERALPRTFVEARRVTLASDPNYFAGRMLQVWHAKATTGAEVETWFLVGPNPWDLYSMESFPSPESALGYYRATQRYDADGLPLDTATGEPIPDL